MNKSHVKGAAAPMVAAAVAAILAACAATPKAPPGSAEVRTKLTALQSQQQLAAQVPTVLQQAEKAVVLAETPQRDAKLASHRVYLADKLVDTARATAETRLAETQRTALKQQSDEARLAARTREADAAQRIASAARADAEVSRAAADNSRNEAELARVEAQNTRNQADAVRGATEAARLAEEQRAMAEKSRYESERARNDTEIARLQGVAISNAADAARNESDAARNVAEASRMAAKGAADAAAAAEGQKQELARQIIILQGRTTDRGIVLTLGDVLFASGSDQLKPGAVGNLDRLVAFMGMYGDRSAAIEGHTDSVGDERYNEALSQRRADSVKAYLSGKGVATTRLTSTGKGESYPVSGNESAGGRQQNRRVEVIIGDAMPRL